VASTDLSSDESALYAIVPEDGSAIGNTRARNILGWSEEVYWPVRNKLEDKALVARGRGKGGTTRRIMPIATSEVVSVRVTADGREGLVAAAEATITREDSLYEPLAAVIGGPWSQDRRTNPFAIEIIARQGRRATGGRWSRPDIVSIEVRTYEYVPGKFLEVVTFEVKPADAIDVQAVYEALAHRRAATRCYVLLHVPVAQAEALRDVIQDVLVVARSYGVGVVIAGDPNEYDTWEELAEAERVEPDPDRLNLFIQTQLSAKTKRSIAQRLR